MSHSKNSKKIVVLAGGFDQIALIQELKKRQYETILVDYFENPPARNVADRFYRESTLDLEAVERIAKKENVSLITTACTDQALHTVAFISEKLGLPFYLTFETVCNITNKKLMKTLFVKHGIPTSKFAIMPPPPHFNF